MEFSFALGALSPRLGQRLMMAIALVLSRLTTATHLETSVVVESVGSYPNVEWLEGNGLDLSDGVLCDNWMRVEGRDDLVAVGDVARFHNPLYGDRPRRVEHWSMPSDTAKRAAMTLVCTLRGDDLDPEPFTPDADLLERPIRPPHHRRR